MRVRVIGAGPAGLYFSYLLKRAMPGAEVEVIDRRERGSTFGFGIVFSDRALDFIIADDPETHAVLCRHLERWDNLAVNLRGRQMVIDGIGFAAIGRQKFISLLEARAVEAGVRLRFGTPHDATDDEGWDLVVGADGVNSAVRNGQSDAFASDLEMLGNRFIWYGAERSFDCLTQTFVDHDAGAFNAHHYRFEADRSTFIVETTDKTWQALGLGEMDEAECRALCETVFAGVLDGARLISNRSTWRQFPVVRNRNWSAGNKVLIGDALHTAHFSIGSGTRLAMEDAIALKQAVCSSPQDVGSALRAFQKERQPILDKLVRAADASASWYQSFEEHMALPLHEFAMSYINRSGRIDPVRLEAMSPAFVAAYQRSVR
jgi:2-polyprenyl-6-methoxyphenol hydroxylase-like FAD-dependent oxidoreductase